MPNLRVMGQEVSRVDGQVATTRSDPGRFEGTCGKGEKEAALTSTRT